MKKNKKYSDSLMDLLRKKNVSFLIEKKEDEDEDENKDEDEDEDRNEDEDEDTSSEESEEEPEESEDFGDDSAEPPAEEPEEDNSIEADDQGDPSDYENEEDIKFQNSLDRALDDVFLDFEKISQMQIKENRKNKKLSLRIIYEDVEKTKASDSLKIDIDKFAEETARLIKNYDNLLDMEAIIFNRAKDFLSNKGYAEVDIKTFKDLLANRHSINFFKDADVKPSPTAVGARGGSSGGGMV
jgi:hypothetical protein